MQSPTRVLPTPLSAWLEAGMFSEVCQRLGVKKTRTTPLHPKSDGLEECFNCTLVTQFAILTSCWDWDSLLPLALWTYQTAVHKVHSRRFLWI